ncbi:MAG TPA: septum formation initiator family protein [Bacteroidales bacterium]|nr:septum formation initiator family protein [Bacteroidales bacterium]
MFRLKITEKIPEAFRNKYFLTILIFTIWLLFLDSNNLVARFRDIRELHKLRTDKEYYSKRVEADKQKLHELRTDDNNLEKFAREQYHMKKPDEDLFIILTPREDRQIRRRNN